MTCKKVIGIFLLFFSPALLAKSEVMFEGYFKIKVGEKHVGYTVQRYTFDSKKKQFRSTYFIQTTKDAGGINESLEAIANDKFQPVSYNYTAKVGNSVKIIDASFEKNVMTATIGNGKTSNKIQKKIQPGTFLSTFLAYLMLQKGYEAGKKFSYQAIAEEDAEIHNGEALIKEKIKYKGKDSYRILNSFKNSQFISYVSPKGEVFGTSSPVQKLSTELVAQPAEATQGLIVPSQSLKILFKSVPLGKVNPMVGTSKDSSTTQKPTQTKPVKIKKPKSSTNKKGS